MNIILLWNYFKNRNNEQWTHEHMNTLSKNWPALRWQIPYFVYKLYDANDDFDDYYYPKMVIGGPMIWSDGFSAGCQICIYILFL